MLGIYHTLTIISATVEYSNEERSQRGMALLNHTYKSLYTEDYPSCLMACMHDSQCMSLNYWWNVPRCDLNNKSKYSADAKVVRNGVSSTYMGLMREAGIKTKIRLILLSFNYMAPICLSALRLLYRVLFVKSCQSW